MAQHLPQEKEQLGLQGLPFFITLTMAMRQYMVHVSQTHRKAHSPPKGFLTFTDRMGSSSL